METAVSGLVQASLDRHLGGHSAPAAPASAPADWRDEWFVFMCPDVSDETAAQITKAGAWPAFTAFFRLLWQRRRQAEKAGRQEQEADCAAGILIGEGVRGLARSIGLTPKAMDRQVRALHRLGILAVAKPPASMVRDEKGRIVRRPAHKGLVPAAKVRFNAGDEHRRPANRQGSNRPLKVVGTDGRQGSNRPLKGRSLKGAIHTTPISPLHTSHSAGGQAVGTGRPAENHRPPAAAGQEAPPLRPWTGPAEEARVAMLRRLEAQKAAYAAREAETAERTAAEAQEAARPPQGATEAAGRLAAAVANLPPASRRKAKRVAKGMAEADRQIAADAAALQAAIDAKRRQEEDESKAAKAAYSDKAKAAFRQAKGAKREAAVPAGA